MRSLLLGVIVLGSSVAYAQEGAPADPAPADPANPGAGNPAPMDPAATTPTPSEPAPPPAAPPFIAPAQPAPMAEPPALATPAPTRSPGFVTMLRQDANSRLGGDITYFVLDSDVDATLLRFDLHGQYVDPSSGFGVYGQVPITYLTENSNSDSSLGGIEVGGIYIPKLSTPGVGLVFRAGLTLPTAPDSDSGFVNLLATYLRPIDLYAQIPKSSSLRLAVSPMFRSGNFFARIDAGLDVNLYVDGSDTAADPGIVIDLGAGFDLGNVAVMGELSTLAVTGDNGESISSFALSVRGNAGAVQPYGALIIPMDSDVKQTFDAGLLAGIEGQL